MSRYKERLIERLEKGNVKLCYNPYNKYESDRIAPTLTTDPTFGKTGGF